VKPGEIYDIKFPYKPGTIDEQGQTSKIRPALVITTEKQTIAIFIKITKSKPTENFPHRIPILNWRRANLNNPSYAEIDSILLLEIDNTPLPYRGTLISSDFKHILNEFIKYHDF